MEMTETTETEETFKPITTQEEFNAAIGERLKKEKAKYKGYLSPEDVEAKYKDYLSPQDVAEKYKGYLTPEEGAEKDAKIKSYEISSVKMKIAREEGIPFELSEKLSGETEEEIRADAKKMAGFVRSTKNSAPLKSSEEPVEDQKKASLRQLANGLTKNYK